MTNKNELMEAIRKAKKIIEKYPRYKIETWSELLKILNTKWEESIASEVKTHTPYAAFWIPIYVDPTIPNDCFRIIWTDWSIKYYKLKIK